MTTTDEIDVSTNRVHEAVKALLADEIPDLEQKKSTLYLFKDPYLHLSFTTLNNYCKSLGKTWWGVCCSFGQMATLHLCAWPDSCCCGSAPDHVFHLAPIDFIILWLFSFFITVILTGGVIICIIAKFPFFMSVFSAYASKHGGVTFINIGKDISNFVCLDYLYAVVVNSSMFKTFTEEELALAKAALSCSEVPQEKEFNLDVAKLLYVFHSGVSF